MEGRAREGWVKAAKRGIGQKGSDTWVRGSVLPSAFWDITGIYASSSGANSELDGRNNLETK